MTLRDRSVELLQIHDEFAGCGFAGIGEDLEFGIARLDPSRCVNSTCRRGREADQERAADPCSHTISLIGIFDLPNPRSSPTLDHEHPT